MLSDANKADVDVSATFTAAPDDDFDGGEYVGDDPVHVTLFVARTVVADRVDATAIAMVDAVTARDGFAVVDVDLDGFFRAPKAERGNPGATHYRITVTARRRID
jgi:uncharacterized protein YjhX (UPF0386 family)